MTKNKKIPFLEFIPIIVISFLLLKFINNIENIYSFMKSFLSILIPFIWAFGIAYILNPLMKYFQNKFKLKRILSIIITYIIVIGLLIIFINTFVPKIIKNIGDLFAHSPDYINQTIQWFNDNIKYSKVYDMLMENSQISNNIPSLLNKISNLTNTFINTFLNTTIKFTSFLVKFVFGLIISIYLLLDKESLIENLKKFILALSGGKNYSKILSFFKEVDMVFSKYIIGKSIDSLIIGLMCFVGLTIMKVPYAALISFIVGITNMIPYFGPFIGMIPAFIITLFFNYIKAIWVLIFIVILQQFDGWYLGPKILGNQVGLSPIWIIFAITIGGGTFGVMGMFLSVPIAAIIKIYLDKYIEMKINKK